MMPAIGSPTMDPLPLLGGGGAGGDRRMGRRPSLRGAAHFLRRASSRRMMREPSMIVRESAAEQLEERQSDWAYSRPVVFLDILWNFSFVLVAAGVLMLSLDESPSMPLRLWIVGYALQCVLHMVCVCIEYRKRVRGQLGVSVGAGSRGSVDSSSSTDLEAGGYGGGSGRDGESSR